MDKVDVMYRLQWGRGCVATEIQSLAKNRGKQFSLQWGRGCVATEIGPPGEFCEKFTGFNGAVAV